MPDALTPTERSRLLNILGRLGSDFDGERAAAGLLVTRLLDAKGLRWPDLIVDGDPVPAGRVWPPHSDRQSFRNWYAEARRCLECADLLTLWEVGFCNDVLRMRRVPTPRQLTKLTDILAKVQAKEGQERSGERRARTWSGGL